MKAKDRPKDQLRSDIDSLGKSQRVEGSRRLKRRREVNERLTEPDNLHLVHGKYSIKDLVNIESLRVILEKFSIATGFTTGFVSYPDQEVLIGTGWRDICTKFHRVFPESKKHCRQSNIFLTEQLKELKELNIHCCKNGLIDGATPVIIRGEHLASLFTGQVFFVKPDIEKFRKRALTYSYDVDSYLEALSKVPIVNEEMFHNALSFLSEMAVLIAKLGLKNYELEEKASLLRDEIFERKLAEAALRKEEEKYRILAEESPLGVSIISRDSQYKYFNPKFVEMFGYELEDIPTGQEWFIKAYPDEQYRKEAINIWVNDLKESKPGAARPRTFNVTCKDGSEKIIHFRPVTMSTAEQFVIYEDVTDRSKAEVEVHRTVSLLRSTLESTADGILVVDRDGKIVTYNEKFVSMWRIPDSIMESGDDNKALAFVLDQLISPEDFLSKVKELYSQPYAESFDTLEFKDGRIFERYSQPQWRGEDIIGRVWSFRDVTDRKQAENELRESEVRFRAVLEAVPDLMIVLDAEGRYREVFTSDSDLLYAPADQLLDKTIHDVLPPEDAQQIQEIIDRVLAEGELQKYEYALKTGGIERWFAGRVTKFKFQNSDCVLWCARDITKRRKAEDALRKSEAELAEQARHLEEVNAALKALLRHRENDKADLEQRLIANVKELVMPYVEKLKNSSSYSDQMTLVSILESNMKEIVSPFVTKLSSRFLNLTHTEIQVAGLIKDGKTSKEIAVLLNTSENTVRSHRFHIRSKLGIKNRKVNLRSYLQSVQD
jgi:PAS domain S-box-containing protein